MYRMICFTFKKPPQAMVEVDLPGFEIEPSQGMHFFVNVSSVGLGYFSVKTKESVVDWDFLEHKYPRLSTYELLGNPEGGQGSSGGSSSSSRCSSSGQSGDSISDLKSGSDSATDSAGGNPSPHDVPIHVAFETKHLIVLRLADGGKASAGSKSSASSDINKSGSSSSLNSDKTSSSTSGKDSEGEDGGENKDGDEEVEKLCFDIRINGKQGNGIIARPKIEVDIVEDGGE
jgi:hypothetical protein